jgi:hypothetical protein
MDATNSLLAGDLLAWIDGLDVDERAEYHPPGAPEDMPPVIHVRAGLADIMITPEGVDRRTDQVMYSMKAHAHGNYQEGVACFRRNREGNERRMREFQQDPDRAVQRAMAEKEGMPLEIIDQLIPMVGQSVVDAIGDKLRGMARPQPTESPVSGGPVGWDGPTGFYL